MFIAYSNIYNEQVSKKHEDENSEKEIGFLVLSILLLISCGYFIFHEFLQIFRGRKDHFKKSLFWKLIKLIRPTMMIVIIVVKMKNRWDSYEAYPII